MVAADYRRRDASVTRGRQSQKESSGTKLGRTLSFGRNRSRSRAATRARSKSRTRFEPRDEPPANHGNNDEEDVNKFVQYKEFGLYATENSRVISIDELPIIKKSSDVIVKVKVSRQRFHSILPFFFDMEKLMY